MKLIDADAFAKKAYDVAYPVVHGWNDHERGLTLLGLAQLLDEMPTIDAIPIEWIVNYVNSYADKQKEITEDVAYIEVLGVTESMIADWRIENYGKTD